MGLQIRFNEIVKKYPKASFIVINKIYWVVGFFYSIWVIQGEIPSMRQWLLGSIYTLVTLPLTYYLTYGFGDKK